ncbi:MAG: DUF2927 domain-containing protein [Minwuia sp.]|nr:DUF2927 domain-containing protein [Minwuia sp.]
MLILVSDVLQTLWQRTGRLLVAATATVAVLAAFPAQIQAQDQEEVPALSRVQVLDAFDAAAFGPADRPDPHLYRWPTDRPVTVRVTGDAPARYRQWTAVQIERLSVITGLQISITQAIGADVLVAFVPHFDDVLNGQYNDLLDRFVASGSRRDSLLAGYRAAGAVCAGQVNARGTHLAEAIVFVPNDHMAPVAHACIATQLSRIMGLPFALPGDQTSALAIDSPHSHLTELDRAMLRLLYHPRMRAGLTRSDARIVAVSVLPEIHPND